MANNISEPLADVVDEPGIRRILRFVDLDELFSTNPDATIINYSQFEDSDFSKRITEMIYSENKNDDVGFIAECICGHLKGNRYIGSTCPQCQSVVKSDFVTNLRHKVWIGVPDGIDYFIHPAAYLCMSSWLSYGRSKSYLEDILNVDGVLPDDIGNVITGRGFNYFHDNFDFIIDFFFNKYQKTKKKSQAQTTKLLIEKYRDIIFCKKLPILSSQLHPIGKGGKTLRYADTGSKNILDSIINLAVIKLNTTTSIISHKRIESIVYKVYISYIEYITDIIKNRLAQKSGHCRKHIYGSRFHGTFRGVMIPHVVPHAVDEIHIPWDAAVNTFKLHIINMLTNRYKYRFIDALNKTTLALVKYDWEIDQIFQTMISEAGYYDTYKDEKGTEFPLLDENGKQVFVDLPGIPVLFNRNPSLSLGSILLVYITKVKPSLNECPTHPDKVLVNDKTITISPLLIAPPNLD